MMKTFRIKASSWIIYTATFLIVIFGGIALGITLLPTKGNPSVAIGLMVIVLGGAFYATRFTARAMTEWTITENDLQIKWLDQFIFHNKPDLNISWNDIEEYKYRPDKNFDLFKLTLKDGKVLKFWHNTYTTDDDFTTFIAAFERRVTLYNEKEASISNDIKRAKTIYETTLGLVLAIFTVILLLSIPILITLSSHKLKINWAGLVVVYSGGLFFIFQVFAQRKKTNGSTAPQDE